MPSRAYVYIVAWHKDGPVKIGVTFSPVSRLTQLQVGLPYRLRIWAAAHVTNADIVEKACHFDLNANRMVGEWFDTTVLAAMRVLTSQASHVDSRWHWWKPTNHERESRDRALSGLPPAKHRPESRQTAPTTPAPKLVRERDSRLITALTDAAYERIMRPRKRRFM